MDRLIHPYRPSLPHPGRFGRLSTHLLGSVEHLRDGMAEVVPAAGAHDSKVGASARRNSSVLDVRLP